MHWKHSYKDREKLLAIKARQRNKYYGRTKNAGRKCAFSENEDKEIIYSTLSDLDLANKLDRSIAAIQIRRCRLRKMGYDIPYKGDYKGA